MTENKQPQIMPAMKDGYCNIAFSEVEVMALLEILSFAKSAASVLAQRETATPAGIPAANRLVRMVSDSKELMRIISLSVDIGEPETEDVH